MNELFRQDPEIRIHELTVEAPKSSEPVPFDPERDVTESDWREITAFINKEKTDSFANYASWVARAVRLFPDRRDEFVLDDETKARLERALSMYIDDYQLNAEGLLLFKAIAALRTLYGDTLDYDRIYSEIEGSLLLYFREGIVHANRLHALMYQAFPRQIKPMITEKLWQNYIVSYHHEREDFRQRTEKDQNHLVIARYEDCLVMMRLLFPDRLKELQPTPDFWPKAAQVYTGARQRGGWIGLLDHALNLKTIAAERIIVGENGVELLLPKRQPPIDSDTRLPEQRKY